MAGGRISRTWSGVGRFTPNGLGISRRMGAGTGANYAQPLHARLKGGGLEPEALGRAVRAADPPAGGLKGLHDSLASEVLRCRLGANRPAIMGAADPVAQLERAAAADDHGALEDVGQLPDVARPVVGRQRVQNRLGYGLDPPPHLGRILQG